MILLVNGSKTLISAMKNIPNSYNLDPEPRSRQQCHHGTSMDPQHTVPLYTAARGPLRPHTTSVKISISHRTYFHVVRALPVQLPCRYKWSHLELCILHSFTCRLPCCFGNTDLRSSLRISTANLHCVQTCRPLPLLCLAAPPSRSASPPRFHVFPVCVHENLPSR